MPSIPGLEVIGFIGFRQQMFINSRRRFFIRAARCANGFPCRDSHSLDHRHCAVKRVLVAWRTAAFWGQRDQIQNLGRKSGEAGRCDKVGTNQKRHSSPKKRYGK